MPNLDKSGPEGKGPRTGRGLGDCKRKKPIKKTDIEEVEDDVFGLGRGGKPRHQNGGPGRGRSNTK